MKTVIEAQQAILEKLKRLSAEEVDLKDSLGRVLAEEVRSNRDHPPSDISAMDGYAVRFDDIKDGTKEAPALLKVVDDIRAGMEAKVAVKTGEAARIMTGAPVPGGADTVIRVEDTDTKKDPAGDTAKILKPSGKGANIRLLGENLRTGDVVLSEGTVIGPAALGTLAMVKKAKPQVYRRPTVAILSTGDEIEALEDDFDERKIPDANSYTALASLKAVGIEATLLGIARDNKEDMEEKLREGLRSDILIVSGGVSVGHHDFTRPVLEELGVKMHFWRVALRPGHPFAFGTSDTTFVFGLPGNPVSSMVCVEQFVIPAVKKLSGTTDLYRETVRATLRTGVKDKKGRLHFMRVKLTEEDGSLYAETTGSQGSGILMSMVEAEGLMVVPAEADEIKAGAEVTVQLLGGRFQRTPGFE